MSDNRDDAETSSITGLLDKPERKNYEEAVGNLMANYGVGFGGGWVPRTDSTKKNKPKKDKKVKGKQSSK